VRLEPSTATAAGEREAFEELVARTAHTPRSAAALRSELARQLVFQARPARDGLDELASLLAHWLDGHRDLDAVAELVSRYPSQPLVQFYAFAMRRQAGDDDGARASLEALRDLDPGDPVAAQLAAALEGTEIRAASQEERLANIAKHASTPLLRNPYQLAVGAIFEAIRDLERARVLDVGVGSGAQLAALLELLRTDDHRLRRIELVGLDFMYEFLARAGARVASSAPGNVEVVFVPVRGRVEELDDAQVRELRGPAGIDAANASISLHEVRGERKTAALRNLRRVAPSHLLLAEWNYCLENVLPTDSMDFLLNVRAASAAFVAALVERYPLDDARAVVRDWLSQGGGQLAAPAESRQECFLHVSTWRALLEQAGFRVAPVEERWLTYAESGARATIEDDGTWIATSRHGDWAPIALLHAIPA